MDDLSGLQQRVEAIEELPQRKNEESIADASDNGSPHTLTSIVAGTPVALEHASLEINSDETHPLAIHDE